ncbi:MAG TPA: protein-disulfide reductase DsbD domain-containing protein [Pyrinomonadaceae bacterium]|nr:protein-disulfide reductase DsbD domain-containing protein [Pyrinomonadaceae bacterium]
MKTSFAALLVCLGMVGCSTPSPTPMTQSAASPSAAEAKKITSIGVVHATANPVQIINGSAELVVTLDIDNGYHVNANPPTFPYLKPTELVISPKEGFSASTVTYPPAVTRKFPFAEKPLAVYEGHAELKSTIRASGAATGEHSLPAVLKVQACDEQVCYPPGQIELNISVLGK